MTNWYSLLNSWYFLLTKCYYKHTVCTYTCQLLLSTEQVLFSHAGQMSLLYKPALLSSDQLLFPNEFILFSVDQLLKYVLSTCHLLCTICRSIINHFMQALILTNQPLFSTCHILFSNRLAAIVYRSSIVL
jgi:hypothetical protein